MMLCIGKLLIVPCVIHTIYKIYLKFTTKWCQSQACLLGKTAIVTGANTGIFLDKKADINVAIFKALDFKQLSILPKEGHE